MEWCCNTKDFFWHRYDKEDRIDSLLDELGKRGISRLIVDSPFFPERAMYWTRMAAGKARQRGLTMVGINRGASLADASSAQSEAAVYDLQEWGRICGLTGLGLLRADLTGLPQVGPSVLAARLARVLEVTLRYGVRLVVAGNDVVPTKDLMQAMYEIGPDGCTLSLPGQPREERLRAWVGEIYSGTHDRTGGDSLLRTIRLDRNGRPFEELDTFLKEHKGTRNG